MKRTTLLLDEKLLEEAVQLSGRKTYSKTVDLVLRDWVNRRKARRILDFRGSGLWEGDIGVMRRDLRGRTGKRRGV